MKILTNKNIAQKIIIAILIVIMFNFSVPVSVQADWGGKLMSPILNFITAIFDGIQHLLEMAMLGETENFMKALATGNAQPAYERSSDGPTIVVDEKIDATFFGLNAINIPVIRYTPGEIFANMVPALDINFIKPSITGDDERNPAVNLREVIASWYVALRTIAIVGLLSVLMYLGIRMLMTSIAADRAKYKQMLMDWLVAMCLVLVLHYIMSLVLTVTETVTAMVATGSNGQFTVHATALDGAFYTTTEETFAANLMSYVRFMIQAEDLNIKIAFFALYVMLVIYSIRFTWVYLKRVVNMAFLTLVAPMVALTYPIDRVSDGKAQAFNMWLKEYIYNAMIQPIHLLLYTVLLGSAAIELAVENPLYAVVTLGFIIAAEKLVKKMFGFEKASGGTVGSLAGAAGVTALAGKAFNSLASGKGGGSGKGKVRTKDIPERTGSDKNANKHLSGFKGKDISQAVGEGGGKQKNTDTNDALLQGDDVPPPPQMSGLNEEEQKEYDNLKDYSQQLDGDELSMQDQEKINRLSELEQKKQEAEQDQSVGQGSEENELEGSQGEGNKLDLKNMSFIGSGQDKKAELKEKLKDRAKRTLMGAKQAAPTLAYKAAKGTLRTASRLALAGAAGTMGAIIGATTGDGDKAMSMALGAAGVGFTTGDNLFDATLGRVMPEEKSVRDSFGAGYYGNAIDARNAKADKKEVNSTRFNDFYEKEFKNQYTKKEFKDIVTSYRQSGITDYKDIKKALKLEQEYKKTNPELDEKTIREQVQNITESYNELSSEQRKAFVNKRRKRKRIYY